MDNAKRQKSIEVQEAIRDILYHEWDPIGVRNAAPEDEYDSYIGGVYSILSSSRSEDELVEYLSKIEIEAMEINPQSRQHLRAVARKLLALDVKL